MQIILLSGGSGTRLWPLSNDARSKQFLRVLDVDDTDELESMVQRVHRQLRESNINAGLTVCSIGYQRHRYRDEVWTFIDGEGMIALDREQRPVKRGDVVKIPKGQLHALETISSLSFIEVQNGSNLIEEDIERFPNEWLD